jgi:hypothetical protein
MPPQIHQQQQQLRHSSSSSHHRHRAIRASAFSIKAVAEDESKTKQVVALSEHVDGLKDVPDVPKDEGFEYWKPRLILLFVATLWGSNFGTVKFVQNADISASAAAGTFKLLN